MSTWTRPNRSLTGGRSRRSRTGKLVAVGDRRERLDRRLLTGAFGEELRLVSLGRGEHYPPPVRAREQGALAAITEWCRTLLRPLRPSLDDDFAICEASLGVGHQQGPNPGLLGEASGGADPIDGLGSSSKASRLAARAG